MKWWLLIAVGSLKPLLGCFPNYTGRRCPGRRFGPRLLFVRDPYRSPGLHQLPQLSDSFRQEAAVAAVVNFGVWMTRVTTITIVPIYAVQQGLNNPGLFLLVVAVVAFPAKPLTGMDFRLSSSPACWGLRPRFCSFR